MGDEKEEDLTKVIRQGRKVIRGVDGDLDAILAKAHRIAARTTPDEDVPNLAGWQVVITGRLRRWDRQEAASQITSICGHFGTRITWSTKFLVVADSAIGNKTATTKKRQATERNIPILTEDMFYRAIDKARKARGMK